MPCQNQYPSVLALLLLGLCLHRVERCGLLLPVFYGLYVCIQSNPLKRIALGRDYEYSLKQSVHLSMFYTLHRV